MQNEDTPQTEDICNIYNKYQHYKELEQISKKKAKANEPMK